MKHLKKNITLTLSVLLSAVVLAGCASKGASHEMMSSEEELKSVCRKLAFKMMDIDNNNASASPFLKQEAAQAELQFKKYQCHKT